MHDPLSVADLVHDELRQRRESGYEVSAIEADLARGPTDDHDQLEARYLELITTKRRIDWHYQEPGLLEEIIAAMPAGNRERAEVAGPSRAELASRILGGWQGRIAGCNSGEAGRGWRFLDTGPDPGISGAGRCLPAARLHPCTGGDAGGFPAARMLAGDDAGAGTRWPPATTTSTIRS